MKRLLYTTLILSGIIAVGIGIYFLLRALSPGTPGVEQTTPPRTTQTTQTQQPNVFLLFNEPVLDYILLEEGKYLVIRPNGTITETTIGSELKKDVTTTAVDNVIRTDSSFDNTKILFALNSVRSPQFSVYDIPTGSWTPLPVGITSAGWSPSDLRIGYVREEDNKITIGILTPEEGANGDELVFSDSSLAEVSARDLSIDWVNEGSVFLSSRPSGTTQGETWIFSLSQNTFQRIASGRGLVASWGIEGDYGIQFLGDGNSYSLVLTDNFAQHLLTLPFITLPEKCSIQFSKIYCAVPERIDDDMFLPDDYYQQEAYFRDSMYVIDLKTGESSRIFDGTLWDIDAVNLRQYNEYLVFKNRLDEKLYALRLPDDLVIFGQSED